MSRIYIGSKISTINSIKNEFPDRVLSLCDNPEVMVKNFSVFFDNNKIFLHDNPNIEKLKIIQTQINSNKGTHYLFYDEYDGPKIANNVWETTKQPENFFNKLKIFFCLLVIASSIQLLNAQAIQYITKDRELALFYHHLLPIA